MLRNVCLSRYEFEVLHFSRIFFRHISSHLTPVRSEEPTNEDAAARKMAKQSRQSSRTKSQTSHHSPNTRRKQRGGQSTCDADNSGTCDSSEPDFPLAVRRVACRFRLCRLVGRHVRNPGEEVLC